MHQHDRRILSLSALPLLLWSACATELASDAMNPEEEPEVAELTEALDQPQPIDTINLAITSDTSIRGLLSNNTNYGAQTSLALNRSLIAVSPAALATATTPNGGDYIVSAKLRLRVSSALVLSLPRILSAYRVTKPWTESGATWNCAIDANPGNFSQDCSGATKWSSAGGDFDPTATGSVTLPLTVGPTYVEIDVTEDVRAFKERADVGGTAGEANYGWLLKTLVELPLDTTTIASSESATPPQLILQVRRCNRTVCDDGITCSQDGFCDSEGLCFHLIAAPLAPCSDGNACTVADGCSGMDFSCIPGTPAPVGTPCGSGLECDAQQQCVPVAPQ